MGQKGVGGRHVLGVRPVFQGGVTFSPSDTVPSVRIRAERKYGRRCNFSELNSLLQET